MFPDKLPAQQPAYTVYKQLNRPLMKNALANTYLQSLYLNNSLYPTNSIILLKKTNLPQQENCLNAAGISNS